MPLCVVFGGGVTSFVCVIFGIIIPLFRIQNIIKQIDNIGHWFPRFPVFQVCYCGWLVSYKWIQTPQFQKWINHILVVLLQMNQGQIRCIGQGIFHWMNLQLIHLIKTIQSILIDLYNHNGDNPEKVLLDIFFDE